MKKMFLLLLVGSALLFAYEIPKSIDNEIRAWVKDTYDIDSYGSSMQKMMYDEEIKSYIWMAKNATDKVTLKRVTNMYPPEEWGYTLLKMMYEEEVKNNSW